MPLPSNSSIQKSGQGHVQWKLQMSGVSRQNAQTIEPIDDGSPYHVILGAAETVSAHRPSIDSVIVGGNPIVPKSATVDCGDWVPYDNETYLNIEDIADNSSLDNSMEENSDEVDYDLEADMKEYFKELDEMHDVEEVQPVHTVGLATCEDSGISHVNGEDQSNSAPSDCAYHIQCFNQPWKLRSLRRQDGGGNIVGPGPQEEETAPLSPESPTSPSFYHRLQYDCASIRGAAEAPPTVDVFEALAYPGWRDSVRTSLEGQDIEQEQWSSQRLDSENRGDEPDLHAKCGTGERPPKEIELAALGYAGWSVSINANLGIALQSPEYGIEEDPKLAEFGDVDVREQSKEDHNTVYVSKDGGSAGCSFTKLPRTVLWSIMYENASCGVDASMEYPKHHCSEVEFCDEVSSHCFVKRNNHLRDAFVRALHGLWDGLAGVPILEMEETEEDSETGESESDGSEEEEVYVEEDLGDPNTMFTTDSG